MTARNRQIFEIVCVCVAFLGAIVGLFTPAWIVLTYYEVDVPNGICQVPVEYSDGTGTVGSSLYDPLFCNGSEWCAYFSFGVMIIGACGMALSVCSIVIAMVLLIRHETFGHTFWGLTGSGIACGVLAIVVWIVCISFINPSAEFVDIRCSGWSFYLFCASTIATILVTMPHLFASAQQTQRDDEHQKQDIPTTNKVQTYHPHEIKRFTRQPDPLPPPSASKPASPTTMETSTHPGHPPATSRQGKRTNGSRRQRR